MDSTFCRMNLTKQNRSKIYRMEHGKEFIMKRKVKGTIGFMAVTLGLVLVTAFCVVMTVKSQSNVEEVAVENYYREKEQEMLADTRAYLSREGFTNSGVTLTRVVDEEGNREYTITVHHRKISNLQEDARETLRVALQELVFEEENCSFCHTFLVNG